MMDEDSSSKFIGSLTKFLQSLCNGYVEFQSGVELAGHIYLSVDTGKKIDYILHEKVCKNDENSVTFISNSFHAQPIEKAKSAVNHQRSDSSPKPKDLPKSARDGEILEGKRKKDEEDDDDLVIVESQGTQPESTNIGTVQSKMPHHDRIGPRGLKRVGSPSASQRLNQRSSAQRNNNPVSSTISSSTSPAHQSNQGSSGSMFPSQSNTRQQSAVPSATVTSQGEIQADNFNMGDMKLEQMTTDELLALTSQVNDDSSSSVQALSSSQLQHTSSGSSSGGVEQTGSGQVWVKQEVSDDDICMQGQSGSTGLGSGWPRRQDGLRGAGGTSGGLYPVMLHQNTAAFSGPNTAFPPGFPPLGVGSSQHPGFSQLPSSSQAAGLLPTSLPGSSHDAVGVDQTETCSLAGIESRALKRVAPSSSLHSQGKHKARNLFCNTCQQNFQTENTVCVHLRGKQNKTFLCSECRMAFFSKLQLRVHKKRSQCGASAAIVCQECGESFFQRTSLSDHVQAKHSGHVFLCGCGKTFHWRPSYNRHKKHCPFKIIHT